MKKIIFFNVPITNEPEKLYFKAKGNASLQYDGKVKFAINAILAKKVEKADNIKIVMLKETQKKEYDKHYEKEFMIEFSKINKSIGAKIKYVMLNKPHEEMRNAHEKLLNAMVNEIDDNSEIYADISFGTKPLPFLVFNILTFAERFCNAKIGNIIYGKKDFSPTKQHEIYDLTSLYYLNSLSNTISCKDSKEAKTVFKKILAI